MSIRSDVGVAIKNELFQTLSEKSKNLLLTAEEWIKSSEGDHLFYFDGINWFLPYNPDIKGLYDELEELTRDDQFLIVEACSDYPEWDENNIGSWDTNPWNLRLRHTCEVTFEV